MAVINFDNAATTFPKPDSVAAAVSKAFTVYGGNPSRGGHELAMNTANAVFGVRSLAAEMFGATPENVVFTLNCTHALNMAIKGVAESGTDVIVSCMEHNSSSRPVFAMCGGRRINIAKVYPDEQRTIESFRALITPQTRVIVCTLASNVTGRIMPYRAIARLCAANNICFIADGAQVCGVLPVTLADGINILCTSGHKGLYGASGTGLLITDGKYPIKPIIEGGTGNASLMLAQPMELPEALESGTLNTAGILGLGAGIEFVKRSGMKRIHNHEKSLCDMFIRGLASLRCAVIYRENGVAYMPIAAFNLYGRDGALIPSEQAAVKLSEGGFCLRAGFQCAALAHGCIGTENGVIRFSPSVFNTRDEVYALINFIRENFARRA